MRIDINHPSTFKTGARLLMLKSRHKDGWVGKERATLRQSYDEESFDKYLEELRSLLQPAERIYASASPRDLNKAGRLFAERLMNAMFDPPEVRQAFFERLNYHWWTSMMQPQTQIRENKWWMFDCDDLNTAFLVKAFFTRPEVTNDQNEVVETYSYNTKSGQHILCRPFNRDLLPRDWVLFPDQNPLILWSYM